MLALSRDSWIPGAVAYCDTFSNRKYSSREMPAVFRLFLIMETGTAS